MYACMHGWMDECMYVYVCVCMYVCMHVCPYLRVSGCLSGRLSVRLYVCMCVYMSVWVYMCECVCLYVWMDGRKFKVQKCEHVMVPVIPARCRSSRPGAGHPGQAYYPRTRSNLRATLAYPAKDCLG